MAERGTIRSRGRRELLAVVIGVLRWENVMRVSRIPGHALLLATLAACSTSVSFFDLPPENWSRMIERVRLI